VTCETWRQNPRFSRHERATNSKQYQNPNVQNSKQKPQDIGICCFGHLAQQAVKKEAQET